ncbi:MAG: thermostable hemolysin delta-VPH [Clostridia bacterium]|nr:thermostable hemolysin delta-VPH [Clostridia bacterium]
MAYYNYHGRITALIKEKHLIRYELLEVYNKISPCIMLHFDNHRPMPIRAHRFEYYLELIKEYYPQLRQSDDNDTKTQC